MQSGLSNSRRSKKLHQNLDILKKVKQLLRNNELSISNGFIQKHKVFKSKKQYTRKLKHKR